jgi:hypothetical protein
MFFQWYTLKNKNNLHKKFLIYFYNFAYLLKIIFFYSYNILDNFYTENPNKAESFGKAIPAIKVVGITIPNYSI